MKTELLKDFAARIEREGLNVFGVAVRQHGTLLDTHDFGVPKGRILLFSASKTWTAMAVGIAEGEGLLSVEDTVADIFRDELPEDCAEGFEKIRLRHLLTMSTGHGVDPSSRAREKYQDPLSLPEGKTVADFWFEDFCREPLAHDPEEGYFLYNNAATYMLSRAVTKKTGLSVRDYLMPRVFTPLGIEDPVWDADSAGVSLGATGLHLNVEELSRGGQVLLNGGKINGVQVIPEAYVKDMAKYHVNNDNKDNGNRDPEANCGYGYQMWLCCYPGAYRMDGFGAKYCIQIPDVDAVVAVTSHETQHGGDILRAVWEEIVPKLQESKS